LTKVSLTDIKVTIVYAEVMAIPLLARGREKKIERRLFKIKLK